MNSAATNPLPRDFSRAWILSLRPRTLPLACCGIITGSSLVPMWGGIWQNAVFWLALITAILLQILANLANDYGDFTKSADTSARLGPKRGMQLGLISPAAMKKAILVTAALTIAVGALLLSTACKLWSEAIFFFLLGVSSLVAALTYTIGRDAYGYRGLGDLSVLIFFGWVAVGGSFYLQAHFLDWRIFLPATACGLLSAVVLNVNNLRDIDEDRKNGKITLAVRLGLRRARLYYQMLLFASFACLALFACLVSPERPWVWLFLLSFPFFYRSVSAARRSSCPEDFRSQLPLALKLNIIALGGLTAGLLMHG